MRTVPINDGRACRLCWRQASRLRVPKRALDLVGANRHGQQLFIAGLFAQLGTTHKAKPRPVPRLVADIVPDAPPLVDHEWLLLFDHPRDLSAAGIGGFPEPQDLHLAAYLDHHVRRHATRHGWGKTTTNRILHGVRILLSIQDTPGARIKASDVLLLRDLQLSVEPTLTVLKAAGVLDDDRTPAIDVWFTRQIAGLPEPMQAELTVWYQVLTFGNNTPPRMRPKAPVTIKTRVMWAMPALRTWATACGYQSLREISANDVKAVLPAGGTPRATMGTALRSIFKILKAKKVIFTDPARAIRTGRPESRTPLPADLSKLREALNSTDPERSAPAALIAFYGLRSGQLRNLRITDIHDQRLHLGDRVIPLAQPVRERLAAYLTYRNQRWPNTANPHLFLNPRSACHTGPVDVTWVNRRLGMAAQTIREDRILYEARASGGDIRRLCDLFGLSVTGATRYTTAPDLQNQLQPQPTV